MICRVFAPILSAAVVAAGSVAQQPGNGTFDFATAWRGIESQFRSACGQHKVVGASLMFVRGADELGFVAFGAADRATDGATRRAVDRDTIFHWASCTKTLTGIAVMQLRDRQRLQLDQPIVDLVPELRAVHDPFGAVDAITLRQLLSHSAGFRMATWPWGGDQEWHPHEPTQWSQLVAMMPYTEIEFAPGSKFAYSNPGIVFLGRAIAQLSGDDYEVYMEKNVLRPLGMQHSYFDLTPYHLQRHRSHSYAVGKDGELTDHGPDFDTGITVSNGGLNAPLPDMARYLAFLLGACPSGSDAQNVLARSSLEEMWQPGLPTSREASEHIGLCFFVQEHAGQRFYTHTGGQRDFVTFFYVHPASGTGALFAANTSTGGAVMQAIRRACMEQLSLPMTKPTAGADDARVAWRALQLRLGAARNGARQITVTVPTGGHEVAFEGVVRDGVNVDVHLKLTTPAGGAVATQALEDLTVEVPATDLQGARQLRVHIATWQRGAHYFVEPAREMAAEFDLH